MDDTLIITAYGSNIYHNNETLNLLELCDKNNCRFYDMFCVKDNKIYICFGIVDDGVRNWCIGTIDILTHEFQMCYKNTHAKISYQQNASRDIFRKEYSKLTGYLYGDTIALNVFSNVYVFDINSLTTQEYSLKEYNFPPKATPMFQWNWLIIQMTKFCYTLMDKQY